MPETCTSDQAIAALGYLRHSFGGYPLSPEEERPYLRLFRTLAPVELRDAIDSLVRKADRRPSPNEIAAEIRKQRRASVAATCTREPWPEPSPEGAERVAAHIAEIKRAAGLERRQAHA